MTTPTTVELTDDQCDEFRRLPLSFRDMVRAIYAAGRASAQGAEPDHTALLKMLAQRARCFPTYPIGAHIPEVFAALGEAPPEPSPKAGDAVPDGWKLVPVDATPEMLATMDECLDDVIVEPRDFAASVWSDMLAAAPAAATERETP